MGARLKETLAFKKGSRLALASAGAVPSAAGLPTVPAEDPSEPQPQVPWVDAVEAARREWLGYRAYFDCVSDPDLVDHAIYAVQAAERKYMYLLRRARRAGVALDAPLGPDAGMDDGAAEVADGTRGLPEPGPEPSAFPVSPPVAAPGSLQQR